MRALLTRLGLVATAFVLLLSILNLLLPQRGGPLAISQILAPFLFLPLVLFLPLWRSGGASGRALRVGLVACLVVFVVRFVPGSVSIPPSPTPGALQLGVTSWNLEFGQADPDVVLAAIREAPPGIVALLELTDRHALPIRDDPDISATFPDHALRRSGGSQGIGLLSSYPFVGDPVIEREPSTILARLDLGAGRTLTVLVAHPLPALFATVGSFPLPLRYDATQRDRELAVVRARLAPALAEGGRVLLLGDFNVVDREPGYADLTAGLVDAQRAVGIGPGLTWRPEAVEWLPFAFLRIDMVLTAGAVRPLAITSDCAPRGSDHCILHATLEVP